MKTTFTKLMAAFALLAALFIPMGMWGQTTRTTTTLLEEDFSSITVGNNTGTSGSSSSWDGNDNFPTVSNAYKAGGAVRIGTGSNTGSITSKSLTVAAGTLTVSFDVKGWTSVEGDIKVTVGSQNQTVSYDATISDSFESKSVDFTISTAGSITVKLATTAKRAFLDNVVITNTPSSTNYTVTLNQTTGGTITASPTSATQGTTITLTATPASGYTFGSWSTSPSVSINNNTFTMPASNVTVSATWTQNGGGTGGDDQWVLTSLADLTSSDVFVIVGNGSYAMTNDNGTSNPPATSAVTITGDEITSTVAANIQWTLSGNATDGYTFYPNGTNSTWLYCSTTNATGSNNNMKVGTGNRKNFELTTYSGQYYLTTKDSYVKRYVCIYDNSDWRGYVQASIVSTNTTFYKKVDGATHSSISANNLSIAFDDTSGEIEYTITNPVAGTTLAANCDANWIRNITVGAESVTFTCSVNNTTSARTATFTLTYEGATDKTVTVTQAASSAGYVILPFAFDDGRADVANTLGLTQSGLGTDYTPSAANDYSPRLKFDTTDDWLLLKFNERPGELSYDIMGNSFNGSTFKVQTSVDGVTYTDFATYTNLVSTKQHITHNNLAEDVRYIKWIYTEKVSGNVALGNIALAAYQAPQEYTMTIGAPQNVTILAYYGNNQSVSNGGTASVLSGSTVTLNMSVHSGYVLDLVAVYDAQENPISLTEVSDHIFSFVMPNSNVTVSADVIEAHPEYYYTRATSLEPGRRYIIVAVRNGVYLAMGAQKNNNRNAKPISVEGTTATVIRSDVHEFTIGSIDGYPGHYFIFDVDGEGESSGYLYASSSSSNWLKTETELDENGHWAITVNPETGEGTLIAQGSNSRNVMRFNQDNGLFSCYAEANSDTQYPVYLYMKDDGFELTIKGYNNDNVKDGYYLIASPVEVAPANVPGLTEGTFDLYYYDDSQTLEWINYETSSGINPDFGNLVPGKGYLYAKKATTPGETYTFTLSGEVYSGDGEIPLVDGWNLIGNPFNEEVEPNIDYYEMNEEGSELIAGESWVIAPMQGIFINNDYGASSASFSILSKGAKKAGLTLNLSQGRGGVIDRAVVRFGEGRQLPKFQLFENSTKVYIPQSDKDYAVVRSASEGEMPVNFKAETNGTYTLSMNVEEVSLGYLHLIDHMTGTDVDLLAIPSYTFDARTTDYESRFKLVFSSICEDADGDNETFAYFNGSAWTVSNVGEATLQVVDVMGRIVDSQSIQGNATLNLDQTPGIYMLRLVNGDNVKVQKVVVR